VSKILLADDNTHAQRMGSQILSQEGHEVITVSNGDQVLEFLSHHRPDVCIVDTRMPGPSGIELCRQIKADKSLKTIKVVLLAGPLEPFDAGEAESVGSDGVLHKPLDAFTLIETVNSLIEEMKSEVLENWNAGEAESQQEPRPAAPPPQKPTPPPPPVATQPRSEEKGGIAARTMVSSDEGVPDARPARSTRQATKVAETGNQPAAGVNGSLPADLVEDFASIVDQALGTSEREEQLRARVEQTVNEVLSAAMPGIAERIIERVMTICQED
jgi:CheY-like chemotaxis protein